MRATPIHEMLGEQAKVWETTLLHIQEILDRWLKVQSAWLYLEPIFSSPDILRQLPVEGGHFRSIDVSWKSLMAECGSCRGKDEASEGPEVLSICGKGGLLSMLDDMVAQLELVQKGLADYLEMKRTAFPRFFFLSNDEMLEVLAETRDPRRVQPHLKKCFEGLNSLKFTDSLDIVGMYSNQMEYLPFDTSISTADAAGAVEKWLVQVEDAMRISVAAVIRNAFAAYAVNERESWVLGGEMFVFY